jgi:hypothetical protein
MKLCSLYYQRGAILLLIVAAMIVGAAALSYALLGDLGAKLKRQNAQEVAQALAEAKENLLIFAESIPEIYAGANSKKSPGFLLCPDMHRLIDPSTGLPDPLSGFSSGTCSWNTSNAIGRLPGSKAANDTNYGNTVPTQYFYFSTPEVQGGQSIWYAIAPEVQYGATGTSNYATNKNPVYDVVAPSLVLDGEGVAAVIISPNIPLGNQSRDRTQAASLQWDDHLESASGGAGGASFVSRPMNINTPFNDIVIGIPWVDFQNRMKAKVCALAAENNWCTATGYSALTNADWFKQFNWGFNATTSAAQICAGTPATPTGINTVQCP